MVREKDKTRFGWKIFNSMDFYFYFPGLIDFFYYIAYVIVTLSMGMVITWLAELPDSVKPEWDSA